MPRILGLDYGTRRVGAALSDPGGTIAFPAEVYVLAVLSTIRVIIVRLVREDEVERVVIGLPLHTSGREGQLAALTRTFGDWLAGVTGRPVVYFDERYTTVEAEHRLIDAGLKRDGSRSATSSPPRSCSRVTSTPAAPRSRPRRLRWRTMKRPTSGPDERAPASARCQPEGLPS